MKDITDTERQELWEVVRREFPEDPMMQEIHFVRLLHHRQTEGMTPEERTRFYASEAGLTKA